MEFAATRKPLECGHFTTLGAESRNKAAMDGLAIEPNRARAAVASVAAFFNAKPAEVAREGAQTLARAGFFFKRLSVDFVAHGVC